MESMGWDVVQFKISEIMQLAKCPCSRCKRKKKSESTSGYEKSMEVLGISHRNYRKLCN